MTDKQKRHIIATVGTLLFLLLLFLLLWFVYLRVPQPVEEEGVEVAFGEVEDAGGYMAEESESVPLPSPETVVPPQASAPSDNDLLTQEDEESLALRRQREQEEKARQLAEAERLQREKEEQARLEKERIAKEKALAAQKAKEEAEKKKAQDVVGGAFASFGKGQGNTGSTDSNGSGDGQGNGQKGNPVGHGSSGGVNWNLDGRSIKSLPKPSNDFSQPGWVEISITVNAAGDVIDARWNGKGTLSDKQTLDIAIVAARKAKFSEGKNTQYGTIRYYFKYTDE